MRCEEDGVQDRIRCNLPKTNGEPVSVLVFAKILRRISYPLPSSRGQGKKKRGKLGGCAVCPDVADEFSAHCDCCNGSSKQHHHEHAPELQEWLAEDQAHSRPPRKLWVRVCAWSRFDHGLETHSVACVLESIVCPPLVSVCRGGCFCQAGRVCLLGQAASEALFCHVLGVGCDTLLRLS